MEVHPLLRRTYARWVDAPRQVKRGRLPQERLAGYVASGTVHAVPATPRAKRFLCFSGFGVLASLELLPDDLRAATSVTLVRHDKPSEEEIRRWGQAELDALFIEHLSGDGFEGRLQSYFEDEFQLRPSAIRAITGLSQRRSRRSSEPLVLDLLSDSFEGRDE